MKILLDENLPEPLARELRRLGHVADSVGRLRLKGIDNGTLYRLALQKYDLCFTKDRGFIHNIRAMKKRGRVKVLLVVLPQRPAEEFMRLFVEAFENTAWRNYANGGAWPKREAR